MFKVSPNLRVTLSAAASSPANTIPFSTIPLTFPSKVVTFSAVSLIFVFCPAFVAFNLSIASLIVLACSVVPSAFVILKVGPTTVPSALTVVPPITFVARFPTAANLPFVAADKSNVYLRTLSAPKSPPVIASPFPVTATVVSFAFTLYVVTPAVAVSFSTVVLIPSATFTASCAAPFANSLTVVFPVSVKLLKSLSAALSIVLRVALSKPNVTTPLSPVVIAKPDLGPSAVVVASVAAVKLNPSCSLTVFLVSPLPAL